MSRWEAQSPFASERDFLPSARTEGLESSYADGKVLLYDTRSHHIHHLDQECTAVWHHCDGRQTSDAISIATGMHPERVKVALKALSDCNLLVDRLPETTSTPQISRRRMAKLVAGALPTIVSISAPLAKAAASEGQSGGCIDYLSYGCAVDSDCCPVAGMTVFCEGGFPGVPIGSCTF